MEEIERNLRRFVRGTDRESPVAFVGRDDALTVLREVVEDLQDGNVQGQTVLVQGVPGAGKTALLNEFRRRLDGNDDVAVVDASPALLKAAPCDMLAYLSHDIPTRIDTDPDRRLTQKAKDLGLQAARLGVFRDQDMRSTLHHTLGIDRDAPLDICLRRYAESVWRPGTTVVLALDEAQNVDVEPGAKHRLGALHGGQHGVPVALFAFGLPDTGERFDALGVSRTSIGHVVALGPLQRGEGRLGIEATLDALGLTLAHPAWREHLKSRKAADAWPTWRAEVADRLAEDAHDFPQHMHNAVRGLCAVLLERGLDRFAPTRELLGAAVKRFHAHRAEYYAGRLGGLGYGHRRALARMAASMAATEKLDPNAVADALAPACRDGESAWDLQRMAVGRGVFQVDDDGLLQFAIHSLHTHLLDRYGVA